MATSKTIATIHGPDPVRVRVLRPIASGGVAIRPIIRPTRRGQAPQVMAVEAVIPRRLARAFGGKYVEVLNAAADPAVEKQATRTPRDKQARGSSTK